MENKTKLHMTFYVFLQSYDISKHDKKHAYYNTVNLLSFYLLPVYKKNDNFHNFIISYRNFHDLPILCYETKRFEKQSFSFNTINDCKTIKKANTNVDFENYHQKIYHAGSWENLSRHGMLQATSLFNYETIENKIIGKQYVDQISIYNTMSYMFDYLQDGIMVGIKKNKIALFLPFSKHDYVNDFYEELYFDKDDKNDLLEYKKNPNAKLGKKLKETVRRYFEKHNISQKNIIWDRRKWFANNCFFKHDTRKEDKFILLYLDMFKTICETREINDCVFMLNIHNYPILRKDRKHPYTLLIKKNIPNKYNNDFCPILSLGSSLENDDIPLITPNDWTRVSEKYYPTNHCKDQSSTSNIHWSDKKDKVIFRGVLDCYIDNILKLGEENSDLLDFKVSIENRLKKTPDSNIEIKKFDNVTIVEEKTNFKYILNFDKYVDNFQLSYDLSLKSVILLVQSHYHVWFSNMLIPYEHYVPVNSDLSNLIEITQWCKSNDKKCQEIANNAFNFYQTNLMKDGILNYMQNVLNKIVLYKDIKINPIKIAIIACYRDNTIHSRYIEMQMYKYLMSKMLINNNINFKIIIVEQTFKDKFNIGKLKNIGFDYINTKESFDNYIFTDIDMIPDFNLLKYFTTITNGINTLAMRGTRYSAIDVNKGKKEFFGGCIACTKVIFERLNGYSNLYSRGWGGEDDNLVIRAKHEKIINYIPKIGNIIDIEEVEGLKIDITKKLKQEKSIGNYDMRRYEMILKHGLYKEDGLSNLSYSTLYENHCDQIYHIIVDPEQILHETKFPDHFDILGFTMEKYKNEMKIINNMPLDQRFI
jgi:hypothetical protein